MDNFIERQDFSKFQKAEKPFTHGKTKKLLKIEGKNDLIISEETDFVSTGDGARMEEVKGKGELSTTINSNMFEYLNNTGINTAYKGRLSKNETIVEKLDMIPVECVFRFVETGSYTKRQKYKAINNENHKANEDGTILPELLIELYYKEDIITSSGVLISDPMIKLDENGVPEIDSEGKLVLLHPNTEEPLEYDNVIKRTSGAENKSNNFPEVRISKKGQKDYIVKSFRFGFENGEFEQACTENSLAPTDIRYIRTYDNNTGKDITGLAKITSDMISASKVGNTTKSEFDSIKESSQMLISETEKVANGVKSLNEKAGMSTLDGKVEFGKDEKGNTKLGDVIDGDSCRIRVVYTVEGEDGKTYLAKEFTDEELELTGKDSSCFETLEVIPEEVQVKKIGIAISLDKQKFREGGSGNSLIKKYEQLAKLSTKALGIHKKELFEGVKKINNEVTDILELENTSPAILREVANSINIVSDIIGR